MRAEGVALIPPRRNKVGGWVGPKNQKTEKQKSEIITKEEQMKIVMDSIYKIYKKVVTNFILGFKNLR